MTYSPAFANHITARVKYLMPMKKKKKHIARSTNKHISPTGFATGNRKWMEGPLFFCSRNGGAGGSWWEGGEGKGGVANHNFRVWSEVLSRLLYIHTDGHGMAWHGIMGEYVRKLSPRMAYVNHTVLLAKRKQAKCHNFTRAAGYIYTYNSI